MGAALLQLLLFFLEAISQALPNLQVLLVLQEVAEEGRAGELLYAFAQLRSPPPEPHGQQDAFLVQEELNMQMNIIFREH